MTNYRDIIVNDLLEITPTDIQVPPAPYDLTQSLEDQIRLTNQLLQRALRSRQRIFALTYAYYLGELLENIPNRRQQSTVSRQISKYYRIACRRVYYIFAPLGLEQIGRTKQITLTTIYRLSFQDFQLFLL